ncbi:GAF domain-containing protein [Chroococcidiopsis sp. SAG 2025]|uniref:GAF domain-containing protein n=1 Tax=Chroococcidiopsis sp. SAG 2025 TaxID=171389 RepID=UPI002937118F|nr:GAF domain-containing protein [Chroococcidiopsis sp. SAG 2025]
MGTAARQKLYPLILRHMGKKVFIQEGVEFLGAEKIELGNEVYLFRNVKLNAWNDNCKILLGDRVAIDRGADISCAGDNCTIEIGDGTFVGPYSCIAGPGNIKIGKDCMIAAHSGIVANNHIFADPLQRIRDQGVTKKGIEIGDDCWLGYGVKVLDGIAIGKGSVIGAGAVVTKDLPPYSIAVGVPAKAIDSRLQVKEEVTHQHEYNQIAQGDLVSARSLSPNAATNAVEAVPANPSRDRAASKNELAHRPLENLLQATLECIRHILEVDTVAVLLQTENGEQLAVHATLGLEEEIETGVRIPIGQGFAGKIAAHPELTIVDDLSTIEIYSPVLRQKGLHSMLGVPLFASNRVVGVFHIGSLHPRHFTNKEAQTVRYVADRIGEAIEPVLRLWQMPDYVSG